MRRHFLKIIQYICIYMFIIFLHFVKNAYNKPKIQIKLIPTKETNNNAEEEI